jgi:hypothetical protein
MKYLFSAVGIIATILCAGCAEMNVQTVHLKSTFDQELASKQIAETGKNTIKGSALMRQAGGTIVTCAGNPVGMIPVTDYSSERMQAIYGNTTKGSRHFDTKIKFVPDLPAYTTNSRKTVCDSQGFFKFENVLDGDFYVATGIQWYAGRNNLQGGRLMQKVSVKGKETKEIVLAP